MPQNLYEVLWIFIIYAFIGWCVEVAFAALDRGIFVNRGFLNGPYCPIYGFGVVIVVAALTPLKENLWLLFLGSMFLTSALEYLTGFLLEKVFHNKWWDYSDKPFNIKGYVCLKFSIYWGLACTFVMDAVHPAIYKGITLIPHTLGVVLLCIFLAVFIVDCSVTVSTILKFNRHLKLMQEMAAQIHKLSDDIGENIYENVEGVLQKKEEFEETHAQLINKLADTREDLRETRDNAKLRISENIMEAKSSIEARSAAVRSNLELQRKELSELSDKYKALYEEKNAGYRRLLKAFPGMISKENDQALQKLKQYWKGESDD